jgi:hypothetical protein
MEVHAETLLYEAGVHYTRDPKIAFEQYYKEFSYKWEHIPTGKSGVTIVYCDDLTGLMTLINHWNKTSDWKYTAF